MKLRKKTQSDNIDAAVAGAVNYEVTVSDLARKSEKRAWIVAFTSLLMSLILLGGYFYMLPLKEKVPYLVLADAYTGTASVASLRNGSGYQSITAQEAITRSNVAHFILARESYDASIIGQRDWRTVYTMSSKDVAAQYDTLRSSNNPQSPFSLYGRTKAIRVKISSTSLIGGGEGGYTGATVRFQRSLFDKSSGKVDPLDNKIATLGFKYNPNLSMDEEDRIENPLGFQVTDYRVDTDFASPPPVEIAMNAQPVAMPAYDGQQPSYQQTTYQGSGAIPSQGLPPAQMDGQPLYQQSGQSTNSAMPNAVPAPQTTNVDSQGVNSR